MGLKRYLQTLKKQTHLSERGFYPILARHIIGELLGYPEAAFRVEPRQQQGIPDLQLLTDEGAAWVVGEIKLDDSEIRDDTKRNHVWVEQAAGYIRPETVYVLLGAPRTCYVVDVTGQLRAGVRIEDDCLVDACTGTKQDLSDARFRALLSPVTYEEATSQQKYERFHRGEAPCGYIELTEETLPHFEAVFQYASEALVQYARKAWDRLAEGHQRYQAGLAEIEEARAKLSGDDVKGHQALDSRRWHLRKKHRIARQIHEEDYPQFLYSQAYAGTHEPEAFLDIFLADTAYVILSRLLFVRLCEDLGLVKKKVSNKGIAVWRELVTNLDTQYQDLLQVAFKDASLIYSRLFEATVFDWCTETDGELSRLLEGILYRLNAFAFGNVDRDLLGRIYQRFLPAQKRKRLGEFYTDDEVVDYILWRTGVTEDEHIGSRLILDPACGSNTFGTRAAVQLLARFGDGPPQHQIERVRDVLIGYDINPFAVFIAQMSLLFTLLPQYRDTKAANPEFHMPAFQVHCINSLLDYRQADLAGVNERAVDGLPGEEGRYDYVVGNPPYVRNERVPPQDRDMLADAYSAVRYKNTDLAAYFAYRGLRRWLRPDGKLGMVVSIGLANSDATSRLRRYLRKWRIDEVVSLEWMAPELFAGADIVPMLVFASRTAPKKSDTITIVSGLRDKADLRRCVDDPKFREEHSSSISREEWQDLSPFGDWCLEVTQEDAPILQKLRARDSIGKGRVGAAHYGIKVGSRRASEAALLPRADAGEGCLPFLKGLDVVRWGISEPDNAFRLDQLDAVSDRSIWNALRRPPDRAGPSIAGSAPDPPACVVVPGVYVTLTSAVISPASATANNSVIVVVPHSATAHALCSVINSLPARYFHFLTMRAGILLRRRSTIYPRTIESLPWPELDDAGLRRLDELSREAHGICAGADVDEVRLAAAMAQDWSDTRRAAVLLDFAEWPEELDAGAAALRRPELAADELAIGKIRVRGDTAGLKLLLWLMQGHAVPVDREAAGALELPRDPADRDQAVQAIERRVASRGALMDRLLEAEGEIDELVMDGLGLSAKQKQYLRERCEEFPLSETVMRPRYLWSEDRKRQPLRRYEKGKRYL